MGVADAAVNFLCWCGGRGRRGGGRQLVAGASLVDEVLQVLDEARRFEEGL